MMQGVPYIGMKNNGNSPLIINDRDDDMENIES